MIKYHHFFKTMYRLQDLKLNLAGYNGMALRVKGDGQIYKLNIKTEERGSDPESTYAATFETTGHPVIFCMCRSNWIALAFCV